MFLAEETLRKNLQVIFGKKEENHPKKINCAAYELRVGKEAFISGENRLIDLKKEKYIAIEPGMFASLLTYESMEIPKDLVGFISLKFSLKSKGLVNISGFHVDPGFKGHLIFTVFNLGPNTITLRYEEEAFLLFLARLEGEASYQGKHQNQKELGSELISWLTGERIDFFQAQKKLSHLETKINFLISAGLGLVLALLAVIVKLLLSGG